MTTPSLDVRETGAGGKNFYFPVVLKVTGVSKYNANQISFEGVPDFWQLPENSPVPPAGTIAKFHLATKPKVGDNAKPGSMYRDIIRIEKASDDEKANYSPRPQATHSERVEHDAPQHQQNGSTAPDGLYDQFGKPTRAYWDDQQRQIRIGQAFNNLTAILAAQNDYKFTDFGFADGHEALGLWARWFSEASQGRPLSPVEPPQDEEVLPDF